jgi:formylglycine-generating enzyme required for sulfatase activity
MVEPNPDKCVSMSRVFLSLSVSKAGRRLLIADCCRNDPNVARGRAFGANITTGDLQDNTAALFACKSGQRAFEDPDAKHGVFTKAFLDAIANAGTAPLTAGALGDKLTEDVEARSLELPGGKKQTPHCVSVGRVDLLIRPRNRPKPSMLSAPFSAAEARAAQQAWAAYSGQDVNLSIALGAGLKMQLVLIPPGEFLMGAPESEARGESDEKPQHRVRITKPFYLGMYEVTQAEWEAVMGNQPSYFSRGGDGKDRVSGLDTSRFPVERVSWEEATEFCRKLGAREGKPYRLPTEAEWEYACRAGTTTPFHFGSMLNGDNANMDGNSPYGTMSKGRYLGRPTDVGSYRANAFGLYDMHGNVWEWCSDRNESDYYSTSAASGPDPTGPSEGSYRVFRGGGWYDVAADCRAADRNGFDPADRNGFVGFRLALSFV